MPAHTNRPVLLLIALALAVTAALGACGAPTPTGEAPGPAPTASLTPETSSPLPTPTSGTIEVPTELAEVTLPLHIQARAGQPGQPVTVSLRWEDGTELSNTYVLLEHPDGGGLLVDSLDWQTETQPPQPKTQPATLTLATESGEVLAQRALVVLSADDPDVRRIDLYWTLGEELDSEQRSVVATDDPEAVALRELLWGPPPGNLAGFGTALPTPDEVLAYPGRGADWGVRVTLLGLTVEDGVATANFSPEMRAYGGGSARVQTIREQITRTLMQFDGIDEVQIAVAGETEGVLEP
jgi:hypothetical protein